MPSYKLEIFKNRLHFMQLSSVIFFGGVCTKGDYKVMVFKRNQTIEQKRQYWFVRSRSDKDKDYSFLSFTPLYIGTSRFHLFTQRVYEPWEASKHLQDILALLAVVPFFCALNKHLMYAKSSLDFTGSSQAPLSARLQILFLGILPLPTFFQRQ